MRPFELERLLEGLDGLVEFARIVVGQAEVGIGIAVGFVEMDGLTVLPYRLIDVACVVVSKPEQVVGKCRRGVDFQGDSILGYGIGVVSCLIVGAPQVDAGIDQIGRFCRSALKGGEGLLRIGKQAGVKVEIKAAVSIGGQS